MGKPGRSSGPGLDQARVITGVHMPVDAGWAAATPYQAYAGGMPWDRAR